MKCAACHNEMIKKKWEVDFRIEDRLNELKATEYFLFVCGKWKDYRSVEDQIGDILTHRKSTDRSELKEDVYLKVVRKARELSGE